jgi:hypothetical protein
MPEVCQEQPTRSLASNADLPFGSFNSIVRSLHHLFHRLLCRFSGIAGCLRNTLSHLLSHLLNLLRLRDSVAQLIQTLLYETPRLFPAQEKDDHTDYNADSPADDESNHPGLHASISFPFLKH